MCISDPTWLRGVKAVAFVVVQHNTVSSSKDLCNFENLPIASLWKSTDWLTSWCCYSTMDTKYDTVWICGSQPHMKSNLPSSPCTSLCLCLPSPSRDAPVDFQSGLLWSHTVGQKELLTRASFLTAAAAAAAAVATLRHCTNKSLCFRSSHGSTAATLIPSYCRFSTWPQLHHGQKSHWRGGGK